MLKSIFKIAGRIVLILAVAGIVAGLTYGVSKAVNITPRFGGDGNRERFQQQPGSLPGQPPRQFRGDDEGFRENGSLLRGIGDVLMNAAGIAIFTLAGWFIFRRYRRRLPDAA
jgi:hypothetical protein